MKRKTKRKTKAPRSAEWVWIGEGRTVVNAKPVTITMPAALYIDFQMLALGKKWIAIKHAKSDGGCHEEAKDEGAQAR